MVSKQDGVQFAKTHGCLFVETSAKVGCCAVKGLTALSLGGVALLVPCLGDLWAACLDCHSCTL